MQDDVKMVIWSNDYDMCHPEDYEDGEELSDYLCEWMESEQKNLDIELNGDERIVAFANMGLWFGRRNGARECGGNVSDIFRAGEGSYYVETFYADRYNVRADLTHHDGTHHVLFRIAKSEYEAQRLVEKIAYGGMTEKQFRKATRSLRPIVAKVYGWRD